MALNDHPRISEDTKKRVKALAMKLNYRPNIIARAMVRKQTNLIGLIITDIMSSFFPQIIQGIEDIVSKHLYSVILCATENETSRERHYLQLLRQKRVDGIIAVPNLGNKNADLWELLLKQEMPIVSILRRLPVNKSPYVIVDNYRGGYMATRHLIEMGHKKIAHLAGPEMLPLSHARKQGYMDALHESGLGVHKALIKITNFNFNDGYKKTLHLVKSNPEITAIFASADIVAIGAIQAIRQMNLRVPEDIAVIGFDDLFFASFSEVPLSSIAQPKYEIGVRAAQKMLDLLDDKEVESEILEPSIVVRQSTDYRLSGVERRAKA